MKTLCAITMLFYLVSASALLADDLGGPGEEHEQFAKMVGAWDTEIKMFIPGVEEPQVSEGSADFELILDGRFLVQDFEGSFAGMEFTGHGMSGYDRIQEKYFGTWIDSSSTGMMVMEGTYDEETGIMTEIGTTTTAIGEMTMKYVTEFESDDEFHLTIYTVEADGTDTKLMEITYTRTEEGDE